MTTTEKPPISSVKTIGFECCYVGAARGVHADWFRNIVAHPQVEVQIQQKHFAATAEPITNSARTADFLELRLRRHPVMIRAMLLMHGVFQSTRTDIERLASTLALVVIRPEKGEKL